MNFGVIYKATNLINNDCYIGQTYQSLNDRRLAHLSTAFNLNNRHYNCHFYRAIRKYGSENFKWEVVCEGIKIEDLNEYEIFYASFLGGFPWGYDSDSGGGNGRVMSEETKKKISEKLKGNKHTLGYHVSEETKKKLSDINKGKVFSEESKLKVSKANKGRHHTEEAKKKMSDAAKGRPCWLTSKHHSEATKLKISLTQKGKPSPNKGKMYSEQIRLNNSISKGAKPFYVYDKETGELIGSWINQAQCARELNIDRRQVNDCLLKRQYSHNGYTFEYVTETNLPSRPRMTINLIGV